MENLLSVRDLQVHYLHGGAHRPVLDGLSLDVCPGEAIGISGESGCGKTTLARAIPRLLPATAQIHGSICWRGVQLLTLPSEALRAVRGRAISWIPQEPSLALNPVRHVESQLTEVLRAHYVMALSRRKAEARMLLERFFGREAERLARQFPHQLSGGERQRVVICQAIACRPALLIADEPTSSLDSILQRDFLDLLRELNRQDGISLIVFSHNLSALRYLGSRRMELRNGRLHECLSS
ncbi:MAG: ABC transporter ATP-binding protein [Bryobacteraceae bacterium]|nr:ABC transporter ATP-binding protein [Bryobacteraceae bacterium]